MPPPRRHARSDDFERTFRNRPKETPLTVNDADPNITEPVPEGWYSSEPAKDSITTPELSEPDPLTTYTMYIDPLPQTQQGQRCLSIASDVLSLFASKNNGYGEPDGDDLGSKGQFADMHRKWKRIRRHLWDGQPWPETGETFEEVLSDFVGHILLTIDFKRRGQ